ncbi:MAG: orotate phosphoribosyltransferase [Candidatus Gracilibacteria bacterium]|nr:orotate phosphoribosyltransferase [Candidatus Gracilibacteria bacterium]
MNSSSIAQGLLETQAVKISVDPPFTWASGIKSPIYCDNRKLIAFPAIRETIVREMITLIRPMNPEVIAGTATAGIPWAAFVAHEMKLPMVYVRPKPKDHGAGKQIEGHLEPGKKIVLVEDLISTGGSSIKAADALRNEGQGTVEDIIAIVTYEMLKATDAMSEAEINLTALTNFTEILTEVKDKGYLQEDQVSLVQQFAQDPSTWWDNFSA